MPGDVGAPPAPPVVEPLLDRAPCGFLSFAEDGTVTLANETLLEMLGYERNQVVGRHVERILTVGSRIFYQTHWFPLLRMHGRAEEIFMLLRTATGEDMGALVNAARREGTGRTVFDCVVMRVRERQKYEDALLRAKRAAEQAHAELEIRTREIERANERLEEQNVELEAQQRELAVQSAELEEATEELRTINEDLQARTEEALRMRAAAEEANRAKSSFLAMMSHELRTPLNGIGGYVQIIEMGIHGPVTDAQKQALGRIALLQAHLLRLINEVLDIAKIEAARIEYAVEDVPVEELVGGVVPVIEPLLSNKGVAFEVDLTPGLVLRGDREKVRQVLINLLGNASKFTPAGGRVAIAATRSIERSGRLLLRVIDSGIGIPPDKLEAIFQPFVQVGRGASEGTGLGLAISRDLARGMGGDLTAESWPGQGSVFTLALPLASL